MEPEGACSSLLAQLRGMQADLQDWLGDLKMQVQQGKVEQLTFLSNAAC